MLAIPNLPEEVLCRDVYPAEVLMPDGTVLRDLRVFATSHRLLAFRANEQRRCEVALDLQLEIPFSVPASMDTMRQGRLECVLADGTGTAWVNLGQGCGCGSPLKALGSPIPWTSRSRTHGHTS